MRRRSLTIAERKRLSESAKANPNWGILHARPATLYVWNCPGCGKEMNRYTRPSPSGYCSSKCFSNTREYVESSTVKDRRSFREQFKESSLSLYSEGIGCKTIAKKIGTTHKVVIKILIDAGVYKPGSLKNSEQHKRLIGEALRDRVPKWRQEQKMREAAKKKKRTRAFADLPLFDISIRNRKRISKGIRFKHKYANDKEFRILHILRKRWNQVAKRGRGYSGDNLAWLGCTPEQFIVHLEKKFKLGMSWDNLGVGDGNWNIDHIRPCASFDFADEAQALECFHYTNAQPMWSRDNIVKGSLWNGVKHKHIKRETITIDSSFAILGPLGVFYSKKVPSIHH